MRRLLTALTLLTFTACGDGPTGTEGPPTGPPSLAILSGDRQETAVEDTIPFQAEVQLTRGGDPVPGQLADWRVTMDGCGEPFVTTTESDSSGVVKNRAIAGTRAHTRIPSPGFCTMEVRWIDQSTGEAVTDTTILYRVVPGPVVDLDSKSQASWTGEPCEARLQPGEGLDLSSCIAALDEFDNLVPDSSRLNAQWAIQLHEDSRGEASGPSGTGWAIDSVPAMHELGWHERRPVRIDTTVDNPNFPPDSGYLADEVLVWSTDIGPMGRSDATAWVNLRVWGPLCWEETHAHEGEVDFDTVPWEEGCTQPWEKW